jgi:hypothetical protein
MASARPKPGTASAFAMGSRHVWANLTGQAPAPGLQVPSVSAAAGPFGSVASTGRLAALRGAEMTAEELADMDIAERRPKSRASRKNRNPQHARPPHGSRGHQRQSAGVLFTALHNLDADRAEPILPTAPDGPADEAERNGKTGHAGRRRDAMQLAARGPIARGGADLPLVTDNYLDQAWQWDVEAVDAGGGLVAAWRGVELRDCGPLPRNAAWPPPLLSVFLEMSAVELGLADWLRVSVSGPQLVGDSMLLPGAIPVQSPPADDDSPGTSQRGAAEAGIADLQASAPYVATVPGVGALAGFRLAVRAAEPVECGWSVVDERHRHQPAASLAAVHAQLRAELTESPAMLAARLDAVGACLEAAGLETDNHVAVRRTTTDGWVLVRLGQARIACALVEVSGVSAPVAVSILTTGSGAFDNDNLLAWSATDPVSSG